MPKPRRPRFRRARARELPAESRPDQADGLAPPAPPRRARGIYLLPNAFTTGALFCGFYAVVQVR